MPRKISETFQMFWEDFGGEDLATLQANQKAFAYYKQDTAFYHILLFQVFSKTPDNISSQHHMQELLKQTNTHGNF